MNNKGQSLVVFVLILPILLFLIAFFIDSGIGLMEKARVEGIVESNMKIILKEKITDQNKIVKVLKENDDNLDVKINITDNKIVLQVESKKKRLFGNLLKIGILDLKVSSCGDYDTLKIEKNCEMIK